MRPPARGGSPARPFVNAAGRDSEHVRLWEGGLRGAAEHAHADFCGPSGVIDRRASVAMAMSEPLPRSETKSRYPMTVRSKSDSLGDYYPEAPR